MSKVNNGQGWGLILVVIGLIFSWPWVIFVGALFILLGTVL